MYKPNECEYMKKIEAVYGAVGQRIRYIREVLGITQETLAKKVGLTRVSINNIENGNQRITLHTIENVANALNTTPKHMLKGLWT